MAIRIINYQEFAISVPDSDSNFILNINIWILRYLFHVKMYVKCKGNLMEVKYFVICTDLLLPLKANFSYFEIQIFMLLKLESESAMQKICHRIRNPNPPIFFCRIAIPDIRTCRAHNALQNEEVLRPEFRKKIYEKY